MSAQRAARAAADVPGNRPAPEVGIRIHERLTPSASPWTVRCGPNGAVVPETDDGTAP
ncbi:hypothetical protein [Streptomyces sp. NPDC012888]|uniref:hypothetical protein n=1 Tax=Streptomyces sp. NPDC012888 TaxID=3364855 RepID=UPI0036C67F39